MGAPLTALLGYDVTDPRSPHSVHVASEADVPDLAPWGHPTLARAVGLADERDAVVVLDHGRAGLYLAAAKGLHYRPPGALGLGAPPALVVDDPDVLVPDGDDIAVREFDPALLSGAHEWSPAEDDGADTDPVPSDADAPAGDRDDPGDGPDPVTDGGEPASPADGEGTPAVTVSPTFDVLVPAFDIEELGEPAEPLERHTVESPTGVGTGTPSG